MIQMNCLGFKTYRYLTLNIFFCLNGIQFLVQLNRHENTNKTFVVL